MRAIWGVGLLAGDLAGSAPNRGAGNNGYGNAGWDRFRHTVSHPVPGSGQVADVR
jgi:hypothetical protein